MTLDERIAKRKAEGWTLSHWVVKSHTGYLTGTRERSLNPIYKARFLTHQDAQRTNAEGRIVPVFTRTIRTKRGHSFSWALARMKEGKRVRLATWNVDAEAYLSLGSVSFVRNGTHWNPSCAEMISTNWELAE